jgi:hypothetical protein
MRLEAKTIQMVFKDVQVGDHILLDEVAVHAEGSSVCFESGIAVSSRNTNAHVILSESRLNQWFAKIAFGHVSNIQITLNSQSVTFKGGYALFRSLKAPFQLDAFIEIDSHSVIKIHPIALKCLGFQLPQSATEMIVKNINIKLNELLQAKNLPVPLKITSVDIHPGRLDIVCETNLEFSTLKSSAPLAAINS